MHAISLLPNVRTQCQCQYIPAGGQSREHRIHHVMGRKVPMEAGRCELQTPHLSGQRLNAGFSFKYTLRTSASIMGKRDSLPAMCLVKTCDLRMSLLANTGLSTHYVNCKHKLKMHA